MIGERRRELSAAERAAVCLLGAVAGAGVAYLLDRLFGGDARLGFALVFALVLFVGTFVISTVQARRRSA